LAYPTGAANRPNKLRTKLITLAFQAFGIPAIDAAEYLLASQNHQMAALLAATNVNASNGR